MRFYKLLWMVSLACLEFAQAIAVAKPALTVAVASSLAPTIALLRATGLHNDPETQVYFNLGSTTWLVRQIKAGADVDVLLAAANELPDKTALAFAANQLALIQTSCDKPGTHKGLDAATMAARALVASKRVVVPHPSVPLGKLAALFLSKHALEGQLVNRLVYVENAQAVYPYLKNGAQQFGFIFATDIARYATQWRKSPVCIYRFPDLKLTYTAYVLRHSAAAIGFVKMLLSADLQRRFEMLGFQSITKEAPLSIH